MANRQATSGDAGMTTHEVGGYVVHADPQWNNGNSATGLALAVLAHKSGRRTDHVVHVAGQTCGQCKS